MTNEVKKRGSRRRRRLTTCQGTVGDVSRRGERERERERQTEYSVCGPSLKTNLASSPFLLLWGMCEPHNRYRLPLLSVVVVADTPLKIQNQSRSLTAVAVAASTPRIVGANRHACTLPPNSPTNCCSSHETIPLMQSEQQQTDLMQVRPTVRNTTERCGGGKM